MRKLIIFGVIIVLALILIIESYMRLFGNYCEPYFDKKLKIVKRIKHTEGVYKTKFTNTGYFRINNEGWNSHRNYFRKQETEDRKQEYDKKLRIAIVGHSNIEGLRVSVDKTLSKVLEDDLNKRGVNAEIYTFGYGGMHLAQAMHVSRYVIQTFQPDMLIIATLLDDFWTDSASKKNFLSLSINNENEIIEIIPNDFIYNEDSPFSFLYFSKFIHYADKKTGLGKAIYSIINKSTRLNRKLRKKSEEELKITGKIGIKYILNEFNKIHKSKGIIPIFFINFPQTIPSYNYDFMKLINLEEQNVKSQLLDIVRDFQFQIINLEKALIDDYAINSRKFDFENDYHYNEHTHMVLGMELSSFIQLYLQQNAAEF